MSKEEDGGPAFPAERIEDAPFMDVGNVMEGAIVKAVHRYPGMSLRDYFAGQWLASLDGDVTVAIRDAAKAKNRDVEVLMAEMAFQVADAMLKARQA